MLVKFQKDEKRPVKIILITALDEDGIPVIDYGVDAKTGKVIVMPESYPPAVGGQYDQDIGEWVIYETQ